MEEERSYQDAIYQTMDVTQRTPEVPERKAQWRGGRQPFVGGPISAPPFHLLAVFGIVIFLLSMSHHTNHQAELDRNLNFLSIAVPLILIFAGAHVLLHGGASSVFQHLSWRSQRPLVPPGTGMTYPDRSTN